MQSIDTRGRNRQEFRGPGAKGKPGKFLSTHCRTEYSVGPCSNGRHSVGAKKPERHAEYVVTLPCPTDRYPGGTNGYIMHGPSALRRSNNRQNAKTRQ